MRGPELHPALARPRAANRVDHLVALPPERDHLEHHLRRVLEVAVHDHDRVAGGEVEPRRDRQLVAEVAGQEEQLHPLVVGAELAHHLAAAVGAAIVDEDELAVPLDLSRHRVEAAVKLRQDLLLVAHRNDERDRRHGTRVIAAAAHNGQTRTGPAASTLSCQGRLERSVGMIEARLATQDPGARRERNRAAYRRRASDAPAHRSGALRLSPARRQAHDRRRGSGSTHVDTAPGARRLGPGGARPGGPWPSPCRPRPWPAPAPRRALPANRRGSRISPPRRDTAPPPGR